MSSFLKSIDLGFRTLLYTKFGECLGISTLSSSTSQNINKGVILYPKEVAQRNVAEKRGKHFLEFINCWRGSMSYDWDRSRTTVARRGISLPTSSGNKAVKGVPVSIPYDIWFWSTDRDKVEECLELYFFWQQNYPKLSLTYDDAYALEFELHFSPVVDESPIDKMFEKGRNYHVFRANVMVDGWIFKDSADALKKIEKIQLTYYDKDNIQSYSEIVVADSNQDTELEEALRMLRTNLYGISQADPISNSFYVKNDHASDFVVDETFFVENSTENNGQYTIVSSVFSAGSTKITVTEPLGGDTDDGNIYLNEN